MAAGRREPTRARRAAARSLPRVHVRGEARLDAVLALTEEASRPQPLPDVLAALCERIAGLLAVDVCSIYLREQPNELDAERRGALVLRATWGYPQAAVGVVRMRIGEGLTGFAVECLRPVSVARAAVDARNKAFPGLDEERFPSLCAVPLVDGGRAVGALVIQRRQPRKFSQREIVLVASVTSPILFAVERARLREREREQQAAAFGLQATGRARPHEVVLRGVGCAPGQALGTVRVRRHARANPVRDSVRALDPADERARLGRALAEAAEEIAALEAWAVEHAPLDRGVMLGLLSTSRFVLDDARMRNRMIKQVQAGASAEDAVERVMREYTRLLANAGDPALADRAHEVEALCLRVRARLDDAREPLQPGAILCAARLTVCDALELAAGHGVGVALTHDDRESPGVAVAVALGLPVVARVGELFRWVADGDRALVDAAGGTLTLNPSRVGVAAFRKKQ